jgi:L-alanine-DL-glutamate epimerase-like enolase superfamily enzyme
LENNLSKIAKVEVGRFDYDFQGEFKFFEPDPDGAVRRPTILVRLTDEEGLQGWGQAVPTPTWSDETPQSVETTIAHYLADAVLGLDPADIATIHDRMNKVIRPAFTVGQPLAKAAIDIACYDLVGKRQQKPISAILGGRQLDELQLSWTINATDMAEIERQLEQGWQRGYHHFNVKVGPPQTTAFDLELVRKVKQFSPQGFLWVDANTGYSVDTALEMLPKFAHAGVAVMESPLPPYSVRGYQALKRQGALPIFMDEGLIQPALVAELIALDMLDGVTVKVSRSSGIWPTKRIVELARERGMMLLGSGLSDPDISLAASLHLFAWAGFDQPCALNGQQYLDNSLLAKSLQQDDDIIQVPDQPGLGLEINEQAERPLSVVKEK